MVRYWRHDMSKIVRSFGTIINTNSPCCGLLNNLPNLCLRYLCSNRLKPSDRLGRGLFCPYSARAVLVRKRNCRIGRTATGTKTGALMSFLLPGEILRQSP